ncbi:MAG TPA: type IV pili methyl-accepting chemotaxis transducer N-terminal domain-containing protein, partial [Burkholderiaceae bacterium]|nr:type IV pili methyl-accepting chemotaxis transducer N-terminal domain-containing protein [Burkholderiaceae bacterium]
MSLMSRITGRSPTNEAAPEPDVVEEPVAHAYERTAVSFDAHGAGPDSVAPDRASTGEQAAAPDSSIISEAAPSEMADFSETRVSDDEEVAAATGTGLPFIGHRPAADQQRIFAVMVGIGLIGLIVMTVLSLVAADRGAAQVGASGQALMQSQRLAKAVSQALVGDPEAFPEVRESAEVLVRNVHGLKSGEGGLAAAPADVQASLDPVLPLVDRAEKSANTVLAQQKVLTQVGRSLRDINAQSSDLLEIAETVSSLKLQQGASPAELSAVGQLVMLTQRIGKSANEFLTTEGVSQEAVFLLGK